MSLYFSYGSNMNVFAMKRRCPGAHLWGAARLPCWRFVLMTSGYATIIPDVGKNVYGALWEVSIPELNDLDRYEEINQGLYVRKRISVFIKPAGAKQAFVYIGQNSCFGRAPHSYMEELITLFGSLEIFVLGLAWLETLNLTE